MKKIILRLTAVTIVATMILTMAVGCKRDDDNLYALPEFVFVSESISLPSEIEEIQNLVYLDGVLYFTDFNYDFDSETYFYTYSSGIYRMNIDGTGFAKLPGYTPSVQAIPDANGGTTIEQMQIDKDGNLWVSEQWRFDGYDLPSDFDIDNDQVWEYAVVFEEGHALRKLNSDGFELVSIDITSVLFDGQQGYLHAFNLDGDGNLYLLAPNMETWSLVVHVLDTFGNKQFQIPTDSWFEDFILLPDGKISFVDSMFTEDGEISRILQTIDFNLQALGDYYELPMNAWQVQPGNNEFALIIRDSSALHGFNPGSDEEAVQLLNWIESDVIVDGIDNIIIISDDHIVCTNRTYDRLTWDSSFEIFILTKTPYSELPQKTIISLATFGVWNVRDAVVQFNRTDPHYRILVADYQQFSTQDDYYAGITRLSTEIISGKMPDILDLSSLPYKQYASRGLLEDLYPFFDADAEYSRSDFVEGAFRAAETDGKLYHLFSSFGINSIVGNPAVLGSAMGWNMDEFREVLNANPNADMPLGRWLTKMSFLQTAISFNIDEYIDWNEGTAHFDTDTFIQLLEFANTFPAEFDYEDLIGFASDTAVTLPSPAPDMNDLSTEGLIASGRQIMEQIYFGDIWSYQWNKALFGGELVFKGFPTENRNGNSLNIDTGFAITTGSENKDGAWAFLRTFLDKDWQLSYTWNFPTNKAAFEAKIEQAMQESNVREFIELRDEEPRAQPTITSITQYDIDLIYALIDAASGTSGWNIDEALWNIISEGVEGYFNGQSTAQDAARVIQSRASIFVSERS